LLVFTYQSVFGQSIYWDYSFDLDSHWGFGGDVIELNGSYYWGVSGNYYSSECRIGYYGLLKLDVEGNPLFENVTIDSTFCDYPEPINPIFHSPSIEPFQNNQVLHLTNQKRPEPLPYDHITSDILLSSYDSLGNILWSHLLLDSGYSETPYDLVSDNEGFFIVGDHCLDFGSDDSAILVRLDNIGNVIWTSEINHSSRSGTRTTDNGYLIVGGEFARLTKLDSAGNQEWHQSAVGLPMFHNIIKLSDDNYLISGVKGGVARLKKIDIEGNEIWSVDSLNFRSNINQSIELNDGSIISTGEYIAVISSNPEVSTIHGWLMKTDANGNVLWEQVYSENSYFSRVMPTSDGGFLLSGVTGLYQGTDWDAWLIKVDSSGYIPNYTVNVNDLSNYLRFDVWPNPMDDVLNIEFPTLQSPQELTVADVTGREILRFIQIKKTRTIDTSGWPSGMYLLNGIDESGQSFSTKILKR
ncbi:MAG: T9SS type A sorting domain-containing protein, partial [Flavobacteriales bacterium]|nr:T9SS type A sorting domain-containing protein [Flavobacteriales bacterium]